MSTVESADALSSVGETWLPDMRRIPYMCVVHNGCISFYHLVIHSVFPSDRMNCISEICTYTPISPFVSANLYSHAL